MLVLTAAAAAASVTPAAVLPSKLHTAAHAAFQTTKSLSLHALEQQNDAKHTTLQSATA
jgi:hypothetical protein